MSTDDILLPYQKAWLEDQAKVKVCEKSRRVGLSWAEAADAVLIAAQNDGDDYWYIGYNQDMAQEFIRDCAFWARHFNEAVGEIEQNVLDDEDKDILIYRIRCASGHRITALSSRPTNLRGKQGVVCIDEAAFHDKLDELIKAAIALLMWGGRVRIISTHDGESNPFNELILDCRAGKRPYSVHRIEFRQAIAQGLFRRICRMTGQEWTAAAEAAWVDELYDFYGAAATEELDVIPSSGAGTPLTRAVIEAVMDNAPVLRYSQQDSFKLLPAHIREAETRDWCEANLAAPLAALDAKRRHYFGSDFARSADLSVMWPLAETQRLANPTPFVIELRNIPFEQQKQILFYFVDRLPNFAAGAMDARGNGQYLAEVAAQRYGGTRIQEVMLSAEWYREHMPRFIAAFEDKTVSMPRDADLLADMRAVKQERGIMKVPDNARTRGSDGQPRHGDAAIALALGLYAAHAMNPPEEFGYQPVPLRRGPDADAYHRPVRITGGFKGRML